MTNILVIRFGALGDLCLLAWTLTALGRGDGPQSRRIQPRVTLVTKAAFAGLFNQVPGVDEVIPLNGPGLRDLRALVNRLRPLTFDLVIDAHNNLRSRLLSVVLGRRPDQRLAKDTFSRLAFLFWRRHSLRLDRTMRERFDELIHISELDQVGFEPHGQNSLTSLPPLAHLATKKRGILPILGIAPGARWDTKRWPVDFFCDLVNRFCAVSSAPVRIFLGPREKVWFPGSRLAQMATNLEQVTFWQERDLVEVASGLAECATLVTNDSGLLHLAEAVGTPVLALFGPTVQEFGYFPSLPASRVLQTELACRPCSRNGKRPCHRGDLACLVDIKPERVLTELLASPPWHGNPADTRTGG